MCITVYIITTCVFNVYSLQLEAQACSPWFWRTQSRLCLQMCESALSWHGCWADAV